MYDIGVKKDVKIDLKGVKIAIELFEPGSFSRAVEQICKEQLEILEHDIIVHSTRKLFRHKSSKEPIPVL